MKLTRSSNDTLKNPADWFAGDVHTYMISALASRRRGRALHTRRLHALAPPRPEEQIH
jgi:hypothetical protein